MMDSKVYVKEYNSNVEIFVRDVCVSIDADGFDEFTPDENMEGIIDFVSDYTVLTDGEKDDLADKLEVWVCCKSKQSDDEMWKAEMM